VNRHLEHPRSSDPGIRPAPDGRPRRFDRVLGDDDRRWLTLAVALSRRCPASSTAFSVGAVVVGADGREISRGYSRETDPRAHAEEVALARVPLDGRPLDGATLYSSLEPCSRRKSRTRACTDLVLAAGISRVVIAWREPPIFVPRCDGVERLRAAGIAVVEAPELAAEAAAVNVHLVGSTPSRSAPPGRAPTVREPGGSG
jgi:diaminohydroxyphosphoribosylaminopyrimidine deaminase / 5-amino-6-(5-phosphoribosylamino)uracil reductase